MSQKSIKQGICVVLFIIAITFMGHITNTAIFQQPGWRSSATLKSEIQQLSIEYVQQVIRESDNSILPGATKLDMSRSLAVVVNNLLEKINRLENEVQRLKNITRCDNNMSKNNTDSKNNKVDVNRDIKHGSRSNESDTIPKDYNYPGIYNYKKNAEV